MGSNPGAPGDDVLQQLVQQIPIPEFLQQVAHALRTNTDFFEAAPHEWQTILLDNFNPNTKPNEPTKTCISRLSVTSETTSIPPSPELDATGQHSQSNRLRRAPQLSHSKLVENLLSTVPADRSVASTAYNIDAPDAARVLATRTPEPADTSLGSVDSCQHQDDTNISDIPETQAMCGIGDDTIPETQAFPLLAPVDKAVNVADGAGDDADDTEDCFHVAAADFDMDDDDFAPTQSQMIDATIAAEKMHASIVADDAELSSLCWNKPPTAALEKRDGSESESAVTPDLDFDVVPVRQGGVEEDALKAEDVVIFADDDAISAMKPAPIVKQSPGRVEEDMFAMPTQIVRTSEAVEKAADAMADDDIFAMPTQIFDMSAVRMQNDRNAAATEEDIFAMPTQRFEPSKYAKPKSGAPKTKTKSIPRIKTPPEFDDSGADDANGVASGAYGQATQVMPAMLDRMSYSGSVAIPLPATADTGNDIQRSQLRRAKKLTLRATSSLLAKPVVTVKVEPESVDTYGATTQLNPYEMAAQAMIIAPNSDANIVDVDPYDLATQAIVVAPPNVDANISKPINVDVDPYDLATQVMSVAPPKVDANISKPANVDVDPYDMATQAMIVAPHVVPAADHDSDATDDGNDNDDEDDPYGAATQRMDVDDFTPPMCTSLPDQKTINNLAAVLQSIASKSATVAPTTVAHRLAKSPSSTRSLHSVKASQSPPSAFRRPLATPSNHFMSNANDEVSTPDFEHIRLPDKRKILEAELAFREVCRRQPHKKMLFADSSSDEDDDTALAILSRRLNGVRVRRNATDVEIVARSSASSKVAKKTSAFVYREPPGRKPAMDAKLPDIAANLPTRNQDATHKSTTKSTSKTPVPTSPANSSSSSKSSSSKRQEATKTPAVESHDEEANRRPNARRAATMRTKDEPEAAALVNPGETLKRSRNNADDVSERAPKRMTRRASNDVIVVAKVRQTEKTATKSTAADASESRKPLEQNNIDDRKRVARTTEKAVRDATTPTVMEDGPSVREPRKRGRPRRQHVEAQPRPIPSPTAACHQSTRTKRVAHQSSTSSAAAAATEPAIMFTVVDPTPYAAIIAKLGGRIVHTPADCTVLVTDKINRTHKFLSAMARGIEIVDRTWLSASAQRRRFVDIAAHRLADPTNESRFKFKLAASLLAARQRPIFRGFVVYVTPSTKPTPTELNSIIKCAGGICILNPYDPPPPEVAHLMAVSTAEDRKLWPLLRKSSGAGGELLIVSTEAVMLSVMQQCLTLKPYRLK